MKRMRWILPMVAGLVLMTAGCAERTYVAVPPPPGPPPLVDMAEHNGFLAGRDDGAHDAYNGFGYQPRRGRAFHDAPGYDPRFGPYGAYQGYFRDAYLRGYAKGFYGR